jgi:4-amino-4-deoxy-L-arabinose transferase-like glycosyltransferase
VRPAEVYDERVAAERRTTRKQLAAILIIGAVVRIVLVWCVGSDRPVNYDALDYNRLAIGLVETGAYTDEAGRLISMRPPFFPAVSAGIYQLFGIENFIAVSAFHAALSLATVLVTYRLAAVVYSPRVGVIAAALTCFYPSLLAYNQFFLSEVVFTFFVTTGALLSVRTLQTARLGVAAMLGLCLGLGALTRSVLWLFAPLLCVGLLFAVSAKLRRRLAIAAVTLLVFAATIAPWSWRNTQVHKTFTVVDVMGGRNVMMGNYEYTPLDRSWATIEIETGDRAWHRVLAAHTANYAQLTQGQIDKLAMRYGLEYFFAHPWRSLQRSTVKFFNFWQLEREIVAGLRQGDFGAAPMFITILVALTVCGVYAVTVFGAIFGVIVVPPMQRIVHIVLLAWVGFPCAIHTIAFAHSRYHLPLIPIMSVYAAAAFAQTSVIIERRKTWAFFMAVLACGALIGSWVREFVVLDLQWFL